MLKVFLFISIFSFSDEEYLNGVVAGVNNEAITLRDIQVQSGILGLKGERHSYEDILALLIEEAIVVQSAREHGIEPRREEVEKCVKEIKGQISGTDQDNVLFKIGYTLRDIERRCKRANTMKLFIESRFLKSLLKSNISEQNIDEKRSRAIEDYKRWLDEALEKSRIEKFLENFKKLEQK